MSTTYTTIFRGEVSPKTRTPIGTPAPQPGYNPGPEKGPRKITPRSPNAPGRNRVPFNPSKPFAPPSAPGQYDIPPKPGGLPLVEPLKRARKFVRPIPGYARKVGKGHPFFRALDLYLTMRENGLLGWIGAEPSVVLPPGGSILGSGCKGIPRTTAGAASGCYPLASHPGQLAPIPNASPANWGIWGQHMNYANELRWFPAIWGAYSIVPPAFPAYGVPGVRAIDGVAMFPPIAPQVVRHEVGLVPRVKPPVPDKPYITDKKHPDKKIKAPPWLVAMATTAFAATEIVDLIDVWFDAMPSKYRKVPMTGVCTKGCRNPGTRFHTPQDKAAAILKNWRNLDSDYVAKGVSGTIINQIEDALMGRLHAGADGARKRAGGSGWGFATG